MVLDFYKLTEPPFGVTPDPQFLYLGRTHREALASVLRGLNAGRGFTALIAGAGMGKTVLLQLILQKLQISTRTAYLSQAHFSPCELLAGLLATLGVEDFGDTFSAMYARLNDTLLRGYNAQKRFVVVIDEAQNLAEPTLELLRVLSNVETPREKLMHFVLSGHPQLAEKLASPQLVQLRQRVSIIARLEPFDAEETRLYIDHRLRVAGYDFAQPLFTQAAFDLIADHTRGVPRNINNVCFNSLSLGFVNKQETIDVDVIHEVLEDLDLQKLIEAGGEVPFVPWSRVGDRDGLEVPMDPNSSESDSHSLSLDNSASGSSDVPGEPQIKHFAAAASSSKTAVFRAGGDSDLRRSSRIEQPVSLIVVGTDRTGELFQEETSATSFNLHGCRYSTRHDYPLGGLVMLQVGGQDGSHSANVRARVRSVSSSKSSLESCLVGVELEQPANVWGVSEPPQDWGSCFRYDKWADRSTITETVTPSPARKPGATVAERVELILDQLLPVFQDKLQQTAERVAEAAIDSRLDESLRVALARIDEHWKTNVSRSEALSAVRINELRDRWEEELEVHRSRTEETSKRLEDLARKAGEGLLELQKLVTLNESEIEHQYDTCLNRSLLQAASEFETIAAQVSERQRAELDRAGNAALRETQPQLDHSVSPEFLDSRLQVERELVFKHLESQLSELSARSDQRHDHLETHSMEMARRIEGLTAEMRSLIVQHEQNIADLSSRFADASSNSIQQRIDDALFAAREQIFGQLDSRIGERAGSLDQRHQFVQQQLQEVSQRLEQLTAETRAQLLETRVLVEQANHELLPQNLTEIQASAHRAVQGIEDAAARVSDRQLVRMMDHKQAVVRELSLDFEARASETRALVEKATNSTLEDFQRRLEGQSELINAEATQRVTSALTSLDAEYRSHREAHHQTLKAEVTRAAEQSMTEFRSGMKAFLYSCLVAAVSAVDQHAQTTLGGFSDDQDKSTLKLDAVSDPKVENHRPSSTTSSP